MMYTYFATKQWSSDGPEEYEVWKYVPKPKNPSIFWTTDDLYDQTSIRGKRLKDVIAKLSFLHPGLKYRKKFETFGDPEWVITFYTDDENMGKKKKEVE
jgi:hypothetical protein